MNEIEHSHRHRARGGARDGQRGARGSRGLRDFFDPHRLRRAMVRRGVRAAILAVLLDTPMHGYQVITELEARTAGRWRPSAGSVYPTLQQLEDEGLVTGREEGGRKVYTLTDAGRTEAEESPFLRHPLFGFKGTGTGAAAGAVDLRKLALQMTGAAMQVSRIGSPDAQQRAAGVLADTRRKLYGILAEDDAEALTEPAGDALHADLHDELHRELHETNSLEDDHLGDEEETSA